MPCCKTTEYRNRVLDSLCNWTKAPVLLLSFYVIIGIGVILYTWSIYLLDRLVYIYPTTSLLFGAAVTIHVASLLVTIWLPMSNFLIWLQYKKPAIPLAYMMGCIFTISLCFLTLLLLEPYRDRDFVRSDYLNKTGQSVAATQNGIPIWVGRVKSFNCCSWYGPYDFGRIYNTPNTRDFIKALEEECFYSKEVVVPDQETKLTPVPGGCAKIIKKAVQESCEQLFFASIIIIFTTLVCILIYLYYYWQMLLTSVEVADTENRRMVAVVAESVTHIQSLMSLQSPSMLRLNEIQQKESQRALSYKERKLAAAEKHSALTPGGTENLTTGPPAHVQENYGASGSPETTVLFRSGPSVNQ